MTRKKKWYALYTKPKCEKKVIDALNRKSFECFCPHTLSAINLFDRQKLMQQPLFSSYVFVHAEDPQSIPLKGLYGVINFVYWMGEPALFADEEIETLREFVDLYPQVKAKKVDVNQDNKLRVTTVPRRYNDGDVIMIRHESVSVYLPSFGYEVTADFSNSNLGSWNSAWVEERLIS